MGELKWITEFVLQTLRILGQKYKLYLKLRAFLKVTVWENVILEDMSFESRVSVSTEAKEREESKSFCKSFCAVESQHCQVIEHLSPSPL